MSNPWEQDWSGKAPPPGAAPWEADWSGKGKAAPKKPEERGLVRGLADVGIEVASGVARGVKFTADAFGADNAVSRGAGAVDDFAREYLSAQAKEDDKRIGEIMAAAQDAGVWEQVKAAAEAFAQAPVRMTANALGTSVPTIAATLIPGVGSAGVAARLGMLGGMGAVQGAGTVKGAIYEAVKGEQMKLPGMTEDEADQIASRAQEYGGANTGNIAAGAALGAAASSTGAQPILAKMLQPKGMLAEAAGGAERGVLARTGMGVVKEAPLEAAQGGQEQLAANMALQNEGFDVPTFRGVAGNAALEGLAAGPMGAITGALDKPDVKPADVTAKPTPPAADPLAPEPIAAVLGAGSLDEAIKAASAATTTAVSRPRVETSPLAAEIRALEDPAARQEALGLVATAQNPNAPGPVRRFAQNRLDEILLSGRQPPVGEATEIDPEVINADPALMQFRSPAQISADGTAEIKAAAGMLQDRRDAAAIAQPLPVGEATEITPEQIELEQIPVGEATELGGPRPEGMAERRRTDGSLIDATGPNAVAAYIERMRNTGTPAARAFVQEFNAGRITRDDVMGLLGANPPKAAPTADERLAAAAGQKQQILPTDLLTGDGMPYGSKTAAGIRAKKEDATVVPVEGGWVVRKEAEGVQSDVPVPAGVAVPAADGAGDQPGGSVPAVRPVAAAGPAGEVQAGLPAPAASGGADQPAAGSGSELDGALTAPRQGFDSEAFDRERADRIKASREAGNVHLDKVPAYVETMRGKQIGYVHDPKVKGRILTVDNNGNVYVEWLDAYSQEKEGAVPMQYGKKTVMQTSLGPRDLKDYALTADGAPATLPDKIKAKKIKAADPAPKAGASLRSVVPAIEPESAAPVRDWAAAPPADIEAELDRLDNEHRALNKRQLATPGIDSPERMALLRQMDAIDGDRRKLVSLLPDEDAATDDEAEEAKFGEPGYEAPENWRNSITQARQYLKDMGVAFNEMPGELGAVVKLIDAKLKPSLPEKVKAKKAASQPKPETAAPPQAQVSQPNPAPGTRMNGPAEKAAADRLEKLAESFYPKDANSPEGAARMSLRSIAGELRKERTVTSVEAILEQAAQRLDRQFSAQADVVREVLDSLRGPAPKTDKAAIRPFRRADGSIGYEAVPIVAPAPAAPVADLSMPDWAKNDGLPEWMMGAGLLTTDVGRDGNDIVGRYAGQEVARVSVADAADQGNPAAQAFSQTMRKRWGIERNAGPDTSVQDARARREGIKDARWSAGDNLRRAIEKAEKAGATDTASRLRDVQRKFDRKDLGPMPANRAAGQVDVMIQGELAEKAKPAAPAKGSTNTVFTEDAKNAALALLKRKLGQINSGIDPEVIQAGITVAGYHIEAGARSFVAYTRAMVGDLGDTVKPYLVGWYMAVRNDPRAAAFKAEMAKASEIEDFEVADIDRIVQTGADPNVLDVAPNGQTFSYRSQDGITVGDRVTWDYKDGKGQRFGTVTKIADGFGKAGGFSASIDGEGMSARSTQLVSTKILRLEPADEPAADVVNGEPMDPATKPEECLLLMPCGDTKLATPARADELYTGPMWQTWRTHRKDGAAPQTFILSAEYGVVSGDQVVKPYDRRMNAALADEQIDDIEEHARLIERRALSDKAGAIKDVQILGGAEYRRVMRALVAELQARGMVAPDASIREITGEIGEQRSQLGAYLRGVGGTAAPQTLPEKVRAKNAQAESADTAAIERPESDENATMSGDMLMPADAEALGALTKEDAGLNAFLDGERQRHLAMFGQQPVRKSLPRAKGDGKGGPLQLPAGTVVISPDEAAKKLAEWKAEAARQGRGGESNNKYGVLSLFDTTGVMAQPWIDAGYTVYTYDLQDGQDINEFSAENLLEQHGNDNIMVVIGQPPCTDFASSGARWWKDKDAKGQTEASNELVRQVIRTVELFRPAVWAMENPVGRIASQNKLPEPTAAFDPWHFGDDYTKRTQFFGRFNPDMPTAQVFPARGSLIHKMSSSAQKERSDTPEGIAYSFFMANNFAGMGPAGRLAAEFAGVDRKLFDAAIAAGNTEFDTRSAVDDSYYENDLETVREILADLGGQPDTTTTAPGGNADKPGPAKPQAARNEAVIELRKRLSVLNALRTCLG